MSCHGVAIHGSVTPLLGVAGSRGGEGAANSEPRAQKASAANVPGGGEGDAVVESCRGGDGAASSEPRANLTSSSWGGEESMADGCGARGTASL